jgi:hypothetical protein
MDCCGAALLGAGPLRLGTYPAAFITTCERCAGETLLFV